MHVNYVEWRVHPFRADRWLEAWRPALERAASFGASECFLTRNIDDPLHFRQVSLWADKDDFERYWASDEISALRQQALNYYNKPVLWAWHSMTAGTETAAGDPEAEAAEVAD